MKKIIISLSDQTYNNLVQKSEELGTTRNKIIEQALRIYIGQIDKAQFRNSYQQAAKDQDLLMIAEEGMVDYLNLVDDIMRL